MDPLVELLETDRPGDSVTLEAGGRTYDGTRFRQTVYRTGNFLRYCGVHEDASVSIVDVNAPETVLGIFGTLLLGSVVDIVPDAPTDDREHSGPEASDTDSVVKAFLGPTSRVSERDLDPGCTAIGFGAEPTDPAIAYFEREIWSENPIFPETALDPERRFIADEDVSVSEAVASAREFAARFDPGMSVAIRSSFADPGTIVAGLFAPLVAGATILLPGSGQHGDVAVAVETAPEPEIIDPGRVR